MRTWIWRNLRIELPDEWEMLQFSPRRAAGHCAFADRYQFRLVLKWRAVAAEPDIERMMADHHATLTAHAETAGIERTRVGAWEGVVGRIRSMLTAWFRRYSAAEGRVVEVVLFWPEARDARLEEAVLDSVCDEPEHRGGLKRWRAFGMDLLASGGLELETCRVEPARASMAFADARGRRRETFGRLGMVSEWLEGTVGGWLSGQMPKRGVAASRSCEVVREHTIETIAGRAPTRRWGGLVSRPSPYGAAAWVCPADGRLYHVSATAAETAPSPRLAGQRLSCCDALELPR